MVFKEGGGMPMAGKIHLTTFENASILRRFNIFFIINSILPLGILYYFYLQMRDVGKLELTATDLSYTLMWVVLGVWVGYAGMRLSIKGLIDVTEVGKQTLREVLDPNRFKELTENKNEIVVLTRTFNEITSRLEEDVKKLESAKKTLHSVLRKVSRGISSMDNIDSFLELIMETVTEAFSAGRGMLLLKDEKKEELRIKITHGVSLDPWRKFSAIPISDDNFGWVMKEKKPLVISRLLLAGSTGRAYGDLFETPILCAPLYLHEKFLGLMCVCGRPQKNDFQEDEVSLIGNLALQTAVAIENAQLNENAEKTYFETISALALAVEARDKYSRGHLDRVAEYAIRIAKRLDLSGEDLHILRDGARLHDIGKIGIPDEVLKKASGLTPQEKEMMRRHTEIGENIIKPISSLRKLCDVVRHHHEFLDGSGYPDGLKGDEISLLTRILTVADIFDALTTNRSYRAAFSLEEAKKELLRMEDKLDPHVVKVFLETLNE